MECCKTDVVILFLITPQAPEHCLENEIFLTYHNRREQVLIKTRLRALVMRFSPNILYFWFGIFFPAFEILFRKYPTVTKLNSNLHGEARIRKGFLKRAILNFSIARAKQLSRVFIEVNNEIVAGLENLKPAIAIGSGMDLSRFEPALAPAGSDIEVVFVGAEGSLWHGDEKLVSLARNFPTWRFSIVEYSELPLGAEDTSPNVSLLGFLKFEKYQEILARASVAIGALSLFVNDMNEGSSLKIREFFAMGIPVILGAPDVDFLAEEDFVLAPPNIPDYIESEFHRIGKFVNEGRG